MISHSDLAAVPHPNRSLKSLVKEIMAKRPRIRRRPASHCENNEPLIGPRWTVAFATFTPSGKFIDTFVKHTAGIGRFREKWDLLAAIIRPVVGAGVSRSAESQAVGDFLTAAGAQPSCLAIEGEAGI